MILMYLTAMAVPAISPSLLTVLLVTGGIGAIILIALNLNAPSTRPGTKGALVLLIVSGAAALLAVITIAWWLGTADPSGAAAIHH